MGDAAEAGIGASNVAVAPTVPELRGLLGALLSDTVLVSHGLGELLRLLDWGQDGIAEGLGIDLRDHGLTVEEGEQATALDQARAIADATAQLGDEALPIVPLTGSPTRIRGGRYLLPRNGQPDLMQLVAHVEGMPLYAEAQLDLMLGLAPGAQGALTRLVEHARAFAERHQIPRATLDAGAEQVVEALIAAASRNATYTADEVRIIEVVAEAFDVPINRSRLASQTDRIELHPGMRVCFTGSPPSGDDHAHLSKQSLRDAASAAGLEETPSVTKKRCDLLVAFDPSSMSGKAKKARELGKPVVAAAEFLDHLGDLSKS